MKTGIFNLTQNDTLNVLNHLMHLDEDSLMYRFGHKPSKEMLETVALKACALDNSFGLWYFGELKGFVEMVPLSDTSAEYAISIDKDFQNRGWGKVLTEVAVEKAYDKNFEQIEIYYNSYNLGISKLIAKCPVLKREREGSQVLAIVDVSTWNNNLMSQKGIVSAV